MYEVHACVPRQAAWAAGAQTCDCAMHAAQAGVAGWFEQ
jgi:hypothetical protein